MSKLKQIVYNKTLLLALDLESSISNIIIDKLFIYFDILLMHDNCITPFLIKCIYHTTSSTTTQSLVMDIESVYSHLKFIPIIYIDNIPKAQYSYVDIDNNIAQITEPIAIEHCKKYEQLYDEFVQYSMLKDSIDNIIDDIENILYSNDIPYELIREKSIRFVLFTEQSQLCIALSNISSITCANVITPDVRTLSGLDVLGKFVRLNNKTITYAKNEHVAVIVKCKYCNKNIVVDWMMDNKCQYCESKCSY